MTMAIPFNLPSDQETEDHYRRLNQLLLDLFEVIQILVRPTRTQVPGPRMRRGDEGTNRHDGPGPNVADTADNRLASEEEEATETQTDSVVPFASSGLDARLHEGSLPDLVMSSIPRSRDPYASRKVLPPRRQRRKVDKNEKRSLSRPSHSINLAFGMEHHATSSSNHQVSSRRRWSEDGEDTVTSESKSVKLSASSLVSLLVPATVSGQIWTTIIIIVGWKLLARQR